MHDRWQHRCAGRNWGLGVSTIFARGPSVPHAHSDLSSRGTRPDAVAGSGIPIVGHGLRLTNTNLWSAQNAHRWLLLTKSEPQRRDIGRVGPWLLLDVPSPKLSSLRLFAGL